MLSERSLTKIIILHLIAIIFVIFNLTKVQISGLSSLIPLFDLMMIFYFTIFKNVFGIWFIFILGIWNDALNGNNLGVTSLCYILLIKFFSILNSKLIIKENFQQTWYQFILFCFLFLLLKWTILSINNNSFYSVTTPIVQLILSSLFYVLMHKLFDYLSQKLLEE